MNPVKQHYYEITLFGLAYGLTQEDIEEDVDVLLELEMYMALAGVQLALDVYYSSDREFNCRPNHKEDAV